MAVQPVPNERDFEAEMAEAIKGAIPKWDFVPSVVAAELVEKLWDKDPDLLTGWLEHRATAIVAERIRELTRHDRTRERRNAVVSAFSEATEQAERGEVSALNAFSVVFEVDVEHNRRRVSDMTGPDHLHVAQRYSESSERSKLLAAFHKAVAKRVGNRRTADVLDEQQYNQMFASIVGG